MISIEHKTIFVHIPKVAGQSIETLFLEDLDLTWDTRESLLLRKKKPNENAPDRLAHLTASEYVDLGYVDSTTYQDYFTFSFVRNPYARAISLYKYLGYANIISFSVFIKKVISEKVKKGDFFFKSQYDYLYSGEGKRLVDFVGKLENIKEDIEYILERSGIEGKKLPHVNKSKKGIKRGLGSLLKNRSLIKDLQIKNIFFQSKQEKMNQTQKEAIFKLYAKDFEYFNYEK